MNREDYVAIAARLLAVYVTIQIILQIPRAAHVLAQGQGVAWAGLYALILAICLAGCTLIWFFPLTVARKLLPAMKESRSGQAIDASIGLSLGLTLIGVWFFAQGLVDAIYWLALAVWAKQNPQMSGFEWTADQAASMIATGFQLGVGAWMVLGTSGIQRHIRRFRYGES